MGPLTKHWHNRALELAGFFRWKAQKRFLPAAADPHFYDGIPRDVLRRMEAEACKAAARVLLEHARNLRGS